MLNRFKPKPEFNRNILTLMTGTTIAQAIPNEIICFVTNITIVMFTLHVVRFLIN